MDQYGLIGYPLRHSFSQGFFNEKFKSEGIDAEYLNFEIPSIGQLPEIIRRYPRLKGLNVTSPYKEQVIPYLDELDPEACSAGAVNVIRIERETGYIRLTGHNTDVTGFTGSIRPLLKAHHCRALVLGTGGASKAVVRGLENLGIEWTLVSRSRQTGRLTYRDLTPGILAQHPVIVNCTPVGMYPSQDACPDIPYGSLTPNHLLYDLIYNPETTLFLQKGAGQGAVTKNGLGMLLLQAVAAWETWNAPVNSLPNQTTNE